MTKKKKYRYFTKAVPLPDGRRKYVRGKTKVELDAKVEKLIHQMGMGVDVGDDTLFGELALEWFDLCKRPSLRRKSQETLRNTVNTHILPYLGNLRPRDITPMHIYAVMANVSDKSHSTQSKVLGALRDIFRLAVENDLMARSPISERLKAGGEHAKEKIPLTAEETGLLLQRVTDSRAQLFLLLCLHTGARRGEALALRYSDIDFKRKVVKIRSNAHLTEQGTVIDAYLKTDAACRDVPLSEELEAMLLFRRKTAESKYLFPMRNGEPMTKSSYNCMFRYISRELPDRKVTAHLLRHTYITRLFEAGLDIKEVQHLAGHATVDMTLGVYTHYDRAGREAETIEKVRASLRAG